MKKKAQQAFDKEIKNIITTTDYKVAKEAFSRLISLADLLDSIGDEKDADRIDGVVKEAAGIWDFLLSGLGGAATTKDQGGGSILDALKGGHLGQFFSKDTLVKIITNFLVGGGIGLLAAELVEVLTQKIPILKWFGDSKFIKLAVESALTYAVMHSNFVTTLVDGIVQQVEQFIGMKQAPKEDAHPQTAPASSPSPVPAAKPVMQAPSNSAQFDVAVPGAKQASTNNSAEFDNAVGFLAAVMKQLQRLRDYYDGLEQDGIEADIGMDPKFNDLLNKRRKLISFIAKEDPTFFENQDPGSLIETPKADKKPWSGEFGVDKEPMDAAAMDILLQNMRAGKGN